MLCHQHSDGTGIQPERNDHFDAGKEKKKKKD